MKKIISLLALFSVCFAVAQSSWKKIEIKNNNLQSRVFSAETPNETLIKPNYYELSLRDFIAELPNSGQKKIITLPNDKGLISKFIAEEVLVFNEPLSPKYGYIKSFNIKGIDDKTAYGKISVGASGVHIMIFYKNNQTFYIDPYVKRKSTYMAYKRNSLQQYSNFKCLLKDEVLEKKTLPALQERNTYTGELRTFKLALSCTGEYAQFHIDRQSVIPTTENEKKAVVLSAMNTTITRVNAIYERDLSIKLEIVLKNGENPLIFLDPKTDDFTNSDANKLIGENQKKCDNIIGNANYDIGHVFSTGAGGLAYLSVVCKEGDKAKGSTGISKPIGDSFDVVYVAHEIGHQFGANHTFNSYCESNREDISSVEPGSGSTIMGYAGICEPNVQNTSDDYFHTVSIEEIQRTIKTATCRVNTKVENTAPIANAGKDVIVPKLTPLVLRGTATDANTPLENLTYCWEQVDKEIASMPPLSTNTAGPIFRSLPPQESPNRYLPALPTVIAGKTSSKWEVIPSVARTMNFSLLVRDNHQGGGAIDSDKIKITVTEADPFIVTEPNTAVTWNVGDIKTISWDKSTTDKAPINCSNVRIKLSTDGGSTFPITLVESTPNNGSCQLTIPNYPTSKARIMVEAIGNIFYNVNNNNFTIKETKSTFLLTSNTAMQSVCNNSTNTATYTITTDFIGSFNEEVSISAENLPNGVKATFNPKTINKSGDVIMTLSNFNNVKEQNYRFIVKGHSSSVVQQLERYLEVLGTSFVNPVLKPIDNNTETLLLPTLKWESNSNTKGYDIQVSENSSFSSLQTEASTTKNTFTLSNTLKPSTKYYWRVRPTNNCGKGNFSDFKSFTTQKAVYCTSTFKYEGEYIKNVTFNTINNDSEKKDAIDGYQDFSSISTKVLPNKSYPISITFNAESYQDHCYVFIDWNQDYIFDKNTERYDLGERSGYENTVNYTITVPADAKKGKTRMRIVLEYTSEDEPYGTGACITDHNEFGYGETEDYTLIVGETQSIDNFSFDNFKLYPNPSNGKIKITFTPINDTVYINLIDLKGRLISAKKYKTEKNEIFSKTVLYKNISPGIYILQIINGKKQTLKKIIIH